MTYPKTFAGVVTLVLLSGLVLLPSSCASFGGGRAAIPEDPRPARWTEGSAGLIVADRFRAITAPGWRYRRMDPTTNGGVFLLGTGDSGAVTYSAQWIPGPSARGGDGNASGTTDVVTATAEFERRRLADLGFETAVEEDDTERQVVGWSDTEEVFTILRPVERAGRTDLIAITIQGDADAVWLDADNRRRAAGSLRMVEEPGETGAGQADSGQAGSGPARARLDGALPEFSAAGDTWEWVADVEDGFVVAGTLDGTTNGTPCVVTIRAVPEDGVGVTARSGVSAPPAYLFTGVALYRMIAEADGVLLVGDRAVYRVSVRAVSSAGRTDRPDATAAVAAEPLGGAPGVLALLEHSVIFDPEELP